jgi:hypothetical protein
MEALETNMDPHTNENKVGELTWARRGANNNTDTKTNLRSHENAKRTGNQLVPSGHGIYPKAQLTSMWIRFDQERTSGPQRNRCLCEKRDNERIEVPCPFSLLAAVEASSGVRIGGGMKRVIGAETYYYGRSREHGISVAP